MAMNGSDFIITSPPSPNYNCIAWAAQEDIRWWEPDVRQSYYWPDSVERRYTVDAYLRAYETAGFQVCDHEGFEDGFEKIALYVKDNGTPTHAARQINGNRWTSKLGPSYDIEHPFVENWSVIICMPESILFDLTGYGRLERLLKRPI